MQTTIKQQMQAVQEAKKRFHKDNTAESDKICKALNDAYSTLASINLNPKTPKP